MKKIFKYVKENLQNKDLSKLFSLLVISLIMTAYFAIPLKMEEVQELIKKEIISCDTETKDFSEIYPYLPDESYVKLYNHYLPLLNGITKIESEGDPMADSGKGDSGLLQQRKISVDEANQILGYKKFSYSDRFIPELQIQMFLIIQRKHNKSNDFQFAARLWNGYDKKMQMKSTYVYWKKVKSAMKENYDFEYVWNKNIENNM